MKNMTKMIGHQFWCKLSQYVGNLSALKIFNLQTFTSLSESCCCDVDRLALKSAIQSGCLQNLWAISWSL